MLNHCQSTETEIKLAFPSEARAAVECHPLLASAEARTVKQRAVYYDTPDLALASAGFGLRVRSEGSTTAQTLKRDDASGGAAATRGEWEWQIRAEPST